MFGDEVGIVLTQACDMTVRGGGLQKPKAERVMLLSGCLVPLDKQSEGSLTHYFKPPSQDGTYVAIEWNMHNPVVLPHAILDLVSLDPEGHAVLPLGRSPTLSPYWTEAYSNYIARICDRLEKS